MDSLLQQASDAFERADAALRNGDLATYQAEIEIAQQLIEQVQGILAPEPEEPVAEPIDSADA